MMPGPLATDPRAARQALARFGSAYAFLLAGLVTLAVSGGTLAAGGYGAGTVVAGVHLLTLGWISLSIFAALRVFGGVALGSPLDAPVRGTVQWVAWLVGVTSFALGLALGWAPAIVLGLAALGVGVAAFTAIAVPAYARATRGHLTRAYLTVALLSLWVVLTLGTLAGLTRSGHAPPLPPGYLQAHLLAAIFGWAGSTVVGVGAHLLPMFALSRATGEGPIRLALPCFASVPVLAAIGAFVPSPFLTAAWAAAAIGSGLWIFQVVRYARARIRRERDSGLGLAAAATALLGLAWVPLLTVELPLPFVALLVVGWLTLFTLGIYHRVVPFLVWFLRFSERVGRGRVPRVGELTDPRVSSFTALGACAGVVIWTVGLALAQPLAVQAGAWLLTAAAAAGLLQIVPLTRTRAAPAPPVRMPALSVEENPR